MFTLGCFSSGLHATLVAAAGHTHMGGMRVALDKTVTSEFCGFTLKASYFSPPRSGSGWARLAAGSVGPRPPFCFSLFSPCFPPSSGVHAERALLPYFGSSPINGFLQGSLRGRFSDWGSPENCNTTGLRPATDFATQQVCWRK